MTKGKEGALRVLLAGKDARLACELEDIAGRIGGFWVRMERCDSCVTALEMLQSGVFDLCLAVEPLHGAPVADFIRRAVARSCRTPILYISADSEPEAMACAMKAGAVDCLVREELTAPLLERSFRYAVERRRLEDEITELLSAAGESARAKAQFISTITHEFKTPLSAVIGMIDMVLDSELTEKQHEDLMLARDSAGSLLGLMANILDWSSLQSGKMALNNRFFHIRQLVAKVLLPLNVAAAHKGLTVTSQIAPEVPEQLFSDPERLSQVVSHLVGNAIKFTDKGEVTLSVAVQESDGHDLVLHWIVSDTGPGIPEERIDTIFHPFTQVDGSSTRRHGGAGLGLSVVRNLVSLLGGKMWVASEPGKGTSFHFTTRCTPSQEDRKPSDRQHWKGDRPQEGAPIKVLAADDSLVNQMLLTEMLQKKGYHVTVVNNGRKAVEATGQEQFAALLLDLQMPVMDGYEAARAIRKREAVGGGRLPIFALTGNNDVHDLERCKEAGIDAYLKKPFRETELLALLQKHVCPVMQNAASDAVPVEAPVTAHVDLDMLLFTFSGNREAVIELLDHFVLEAGAQLHNLRCGLAAGDETLIEQSAHKLKGMAANMGVACMADDAFRIQLAVRKGDFDTPKGALERLEGMLPSIVRQAGALREGKASANRCSPLP